MTNTQSPTASQQERILKLAQAGNPKVIAALLNHKLKAQEITAQVRWQNQVLRVALESSQVPDRSFSLDIIERGLKRLEIDGLNRVDISAYVPDSDQACWQEVIQLNSGSLAIDLAAWLESGTSLSDAVIEVAAPQGLTHRDHLTPSPLPTEPEQKYLCFQIGLENTAMLPVESIQEILRLEAAQILSVPDMPETVLGIYNWRGEMLWLIDLNHLLGIEGLTTPTLDLLTAIVLEIDHQRLGIVVQQVEEIEAHNPNKLQPPAGLFSRHLEPFIEGYLRDARSIVLNPQAILTASTQQNARYSSNQ
ncbi:chemotaxis protein CheW [Spirulina sp. CS-785/01]|uniref:chemotaxis protein CheW n=1 Tax=Spirulina sp. CS-785/01 TaxID=3021716 RepID=UPI00232FA841|nr:chemotaxis protein CheW [Spirulina sp. CS-785/01]MDB9312737.1 chemotaxis protein CheW [Spirulina sp. CS-785/01]